MSVRADHQISQPQHVPVGFRPDELLYLGEYEDQPPPGLSHPAPDTTKHRTYCVIVCRTNGILERCKQALTESNDRLRRRPHPARQPFDYGPAFVEASPTGGGRVLMTVHWRSTAYFERRRNAWQNATHQKIFTTIGVAAADITVLHDTDPESL